LQLSIMQPFEQFTGINAQPTYNQTPGNLQTSFLPSISQILPRMAAKI